MKRVGAGLYRETFTNKATQEPVHMTVFQPFGENDGPVKGEWLYEASDDSDAHGGCPSRKIGRAHV